MNRPELFYKSVNILQKAYYNGTLEHGVCDACAVGNLISGNGYVFDDNDIFISSWVTKIDKEIRKTVYKSPYILKEYCDITANKQISSTGYSLLECAKIENAFESMDKDNDKDGFFGLCTVLDVLMEFHEFDKELPAKEKIFNKNELILLEI